MSSKGAAKRPLRSSHAKLFVTYLLDVIGLARGELEASRAPLLRHCLTLATERKFKLKCGWTDDGEGWRYSVRLTDSARRALEEF